jgi:hypothetical protein
VAYNFQTGNNKIKLLIEYESATQNFSLLVDIYFLNYIFIFHKQIYFISGLKIICHGNPDNNLESHCTIQKSATDYITRITANNIQFTQLLKSIYNYFNSMLINALTIFCRSSSSEFSSSGPLTLNLTLYICSLVYLNM